MLQVAYQLYSAREDMARDFEGTLRKVKALGYDGVEFAGLFGKNPADIKAMLKEIGLVPASAHVPFVDMMADPEKVLGDYAEIGCSYIAIPYLTEEYRPGAGKFNEVIKGAEILGKLCQKLGMTLLYHNHDFEFVKLDDKYALDVLYDTVPPELLQTEIDTCWVKVAGEDPSAYVRKYTGRAPVVHLKDFRMTGTGGRMYGLIGIDDEPTADNAVENTFSFLPIGKGCQDIPAILEAAADAGARWVVVEQDEPSMEKSALECAEISIDYLKGVM